MFTLVFATFLQFAARLAVRVLAPIVTLAERIAADVAILDCRSRRFGCLGSGFRFRLRMLSLIWALHHHLSASRTFLTCYGSLSHSTQREEAADKEE